MGMLEGLTLESLFLIIFGVFIFVLGTTSLRTRLKTKKNGIVQEGTVVKSICIQKRDAEGYLIQNYYEIKVEYSDNGHKTQSIMNSLQEFHVGDKIKLIKSNLSKGKVSVYEEDMLPSVTTWIIILGGILIAMIPIVKKKFDVLGVSWTLAALLLLSGISLLAIYEKDKKRKVIPIDATVVDLLKWYSGKKESKITKQSTSYYPILQYIMNNQQTTMRSKYNSSVEKSFKVGSKRTIYYDCDNHCIIERKPKKSMLVGGIVLISISLIGIISSLLEMI